MYDLNGAWLMGGYFIANVSPSMSEETFKFPSGHTAKYKLAGNPVKIDSPVDEVCLVYRRGTEEWEELLNIRASVNERVDAFRRTREKAMQAELKKEIDQLVTVELATRGVLVEGKEHIGEPHLPRTEEQIAADAAADEQYFDDEEKDETEVGAEPVDVTTVETDPVVHTCPEDGCGSYFDTAKQLQGHALSHRK